MKNAFALKWLCKQKDKNSRQRYRARSGWRDLRTLLGTLLEEEARSRVGLRCTMFEGAQTYEENLHAEAEERRRGRKQ